jgi:ribosome recycling factor
LISVWIQAIPAVEKAIQKSDLGINPSNDGKVIRLLFPESTKNAEKISSRSLRKRAREQVAIRAIRRDANEQIKKDEKDK